LKEKTAAPVKKIADHVALQKLALSSPTSGGRSIGIVRSRTQATKFFLEEQINALLLFALQQL
jgi:hypothetical protein